MSDRQASSRTSSRDVVAYLSWWDYMLWREQHRLDPTVGWQADMSYDEIAEIVGVEAPRLAPGEITGDEMRNVALYWPGPVPEMAVC